MPLPCVAMAPPSLIDYVLSRNLADGVVVAGCAESACLPPARRRLDQAALCRRARSLPAGARAARSPHHDLGLGARERTLLERSSPASPPQVAATSADAAAPPPSMLRPTAARADASPAAGGDACHDRTYVRLVGQFAVIAAVFAAVAAFADWPLYRQIPPGPAIMMLSLRARRGPAAPSAGGSRPRRSPSCRPTCGEPQDCPRGRRPDLCRARCRRADRSIAPRCRRPASPAMGPRACTGVSWCRPDQYDVAVAHARHAARRRLRPSARAAGSRSRRTRCSSSTSAPEAAGSCSVIERAGKQPMALLQWKDQYSVGIEAVDHEHRS